MSINNKPHQSEPFTVREPDGMGGMVERVADSWYNYLDSIDREINTTIIQEITNATYGAPDVDSSIPYQMADNGRKVQQLERVIAQLLAEISAIRLPARLPAVLTVSADFTTYRSATVRVTSSAIITLNPTPRDREVVTVSNGGARVTVTGGIKTISGLPRITTITKGTAIKMVYYSALGEWVIE